MCEQHHSEFVSPCRPHEFYFRLADDVRAVAIGVAVAGVFGIVALVDKIRLLFLCQCSITAKRSPMARPKRFATIRASLPPFSVTRRSAYERSLAQIGNVTAGYGNISVLHGVSLDMSNSKMSALGH